MLLPTHKELHCTVDTVTINCICMYIYMCVCVCVCVCVRACVRACVAHQCSVVNEWGELPEIHWSMAKMLALISISM